jgi:hypothetical protein
LGLLVLMVVIRAEDERAELIHARLLQR